MSPYDAFRDSVQWQRSLGGSEYAGVEDLEAVRVIPCRIIEAVRDVAGDLVSRETIWTYPNHAIAPKDRLNGGRVAAVDAAKGPAGDVRWWIAHVER